MTTFKNLKNPIRLGNKTLKNRIVFGAHTANMSDNGLPGKRHQAYYEERAIGGAAMIVVEPMPVHAAAVLTRGNFLPNNDAVIPHFKKITTACKRHDCVMIQQLYHVGQHGDADLSYHANWSPSGGNSYHDSDGSHVMSTTEIEDTIESFALAALRCKKAGFDGVEVWAQYHSLLDQFWSPWSNQREDEWGGSLLNRLRLSDRIFNTIRNLCGDDFIIGFSVSEYDSAPNVLTLSEQLEIIAYHDQKHQFDYISCTRGGYMDYDRLMPTFVHAENLAIDFSEAVKDVVKNALVTAENHIRTPQNADYAIGSGVCDLVSIVRGQIADPHWVHKTLSERDEDIRGCISCNQMCWGRRSRDYWISCLVNPTAGREFETGGDRFNQTEQAKNILIIGAGPAGLECARSAAERGHNVTLCEASNELGGQFRLAGLAPRRGQITDLLNWYQRQLNRLNVNVYYNTYMESNDVSQFEPDSVILATGSVPRENGLQRWRMDVDKLPGFEHGNIFSPEDVFRKQARIDGDVIVVDEGGNWRGLGTAWQLAKNGHNVTIVTPDAYVGKELTRTSADFPIRKQLAKLGVKFKVESVIQHWTGDSADVRSLLDSSVETITASAIVFATTNIALNDIELDLRKQQRPYKTFSIGDCVAPRQAPYAFYDGRMMGLKL